MRSCPGLLLTHKLAKHHVFKHKLAKLIPAYIGHEFLYFGQGPGPKQPSLATLHGSEALRLPAGQHGIEAKGSLPLQLN